MDIEVGCGGGMRGWMRLRRTVFMDSGYRPPPPYDSLRDCAGMTGGWFWVKMFVLGWCGIFFMVLNHEEDTGAGTPRLYFLVGEGWVTIRGN